MTARAYRLGAAIRSHGVGTACAKVAPDLPNRLDTGTCITLPAAAAVPGARLWQTIGV